MRKPVDQPTLQQKIQALSFCIQKTYDMHGSVTGQEHKCAEPARCGCEYGDSIRVLKYIRRGMYTQISRSRSAKKEGIR
jgi:hypothetical protein